MTITRPKPSHTLAPWALPLIIFTLGLLVTYLLFRSSHNSARQDFKNYFDFRVREAVGRIEMRVQTYEEVLRGAAGLFEASKNVTREEFRSYVATLQLAEYLPGIQGVGFTIAIPPAEKQRHITQIRSEGFPEYSIRPEGQRELYTSIIYLEPFSGRNLRAFGFDMYSEPIRRAAMQRALENGSPSISGKVRLVQESGRQEQPGFLMYLPIYRNDRPHGSLEERRENIVGWVYAPFRMYDFMHGLMGEQATDLDIEIFDGNSASRDSLLYDSDGVMADSSSETVHVEHHSLRILGHDWTLRVRPLAPIKARVDTLTPGIVAVIGTMTSLLVSLLVWSLASGRERALAAASRMNIDLIAERYRLNGIIEGTRVGTWEWNVQTGQTVFNQYWANIVGYDLHELEPVSIETWNGLVHPDDALVSAALLEKHFSGELDYYECEARMKHKRGHWVWVLDRGKVATWTPDGKPLMMFGTHQDITERKLAENKVQHDAHHDALTGLPNRVLLSDRLQQALLIARREKTHLAVIFLDLDKFKPVNDEHGHDVGDALLQEVARRIQHCLRESDTVARFGGDEFVVLLTTIDDERDALKIAEKIHNALNQPFEIHHRRLEISSSSGLAIYPQHGEDAALLMKHADIAMYYAKGEGRDRVQIYKADMPR